MKKTVSILTAALLAVSSSISAMAASYRLGGANFSIPDSWDMTEQDNVSISFEKRYSEFEDIEAAAFDIEGAYDISALNNAEMEELLNEIFDNYTLAEMYTGASNIWVSTDSILSNRELINNVEYYRYEKAYTVHGRNAVDLPSYLTVFCRMYNNKLYVFSYSRATTQNHFSEFYSMLESMTIDKISITVNGSAVYSDSDPVIYNERTMVPIRAVAEAMGYTVSWNEEYQAAAITKGSDMILFGVGEYIAVKNYEEYQIDTAPFILNERTYLPVRAVAELMGANVSWDGSTQTVIINQ